MSVTRLVVVPVQAGSGMASLPRGRQPTGGPVGIGFTTEGGLAHARGAAWPWIWLDVRAMRAMLALVGVPHGYPPAADREFSDSAGPVTDPHMIECN